MKKETLLGLIAVIFVVSGASGLVYQIAWFKYLSLFLGNTTYAQTVVLATFMGGLAIGASLWGRKSDRTKHPLKLYALLELAIGAYCLLYPWIIEIVRSLFISVVQMSGLPSDSLTVLVLKLLISILTLLFPTILMGGTLPVLVRTISVDIKDSGKNVATLYFLNSFGAVVGSMLGGFLMIPIVGLRATVYSAGTINVLVGGVAWLLARSWREESFEPVSSGVPSMIFSDREIRLAILIAGISGLASMIYEITWLRLLIPVIGSSTYSYTLLLVAFISGITIGSWIASRLFTRVKNTYRLLTLCQFGVGIAMALSLPLYGRVPYIYWHLGRILNRTEFTYPIFLSLQFLLGFGIMLVPTIFLGMSLPIASHIASRKLEVLGRSVGNVFSINTVGTVIGSLAAGLILIPLVGIRISMELGLCLNIGAGILLLLYSSDISASRKIISIGGAGTLALVFFLLTSDWNRTIALSGVFRHLVKNDIPPSSYAEFEAGIDARNVRYFKEGPTATVGIVEYFTPFGLNTSLMINGKVDASSVGDLPTQVLLAEIPMILHPAPDTVLVVGLGSGVTVGSVLRHPVTSVATVEISPEVIEASKYFDYVNGSPLSDKRSRLLVDDALSFVKLSRSHFDVIISEPTNPWIAGVGNLYTVEFLRECRDKLKENGMMVQWFHLYEVSDETFDLVMRTFTSVFPHVSLWQPYLKDVIVVGSMKPVQLDEEAVNRKFRIPAVRADLRRIQIEDPTTFLTLEFLSQTALLNYVGVGELNTENQPLLEYRAPRDFFVNQGAFRIMNADERQAIGAGSIMLQKILSQRALTDSEMVNVGRFHCLANRGNLILGYSLLVQYLGNHAKDVNALRSLADVTRSMGRVEESIAYQKRIADLLPHDPEALGTYAWQKFLFDRGAASAATHFNAEESRRLLEQCTQLTKDTVGYFHAQLGDIFFAQQLYKPALEQYKTFIKILNQYKQDARVQPDMVLLNAAKCARAVGEESTAMGYALEAARINPQNEEAKDFFYNAWVKGVQKDR
jgi:spermidine synthase